MEEKDKTLENDVNKTDVKKEENVTKEDSDKTSIKKEDKKFNDLVEKKAKEMVNSIISQRINDLKATHEEEKKQAVADALKKANMTAEELKAEEIKDLQSKYSTLETQYKNIVNSTLIKEKLIEANLPHQESIVKSLLPNIETIDEVIKDLKTALEDKVQKEVDIKLKSSDLDIRTSETSLPTKEKKIYPNTASKIGIG